MPIFEAACRSVQPHRLLESFDWSVHLDRRLDEYRRVRAVGAGKACMAMASAVEQVLGDRLDDGFVVVPHGYPETYPEYLRRPDRIAVVEAGHPVPDALGIVAAERALRMAKDSSEDDLLLVLVSGGGSALWLSPAAGLDLSDARITVQLLLRSGADIHEINTVRKHLSRIKGGRLARAAFPATVLALLISDVVGDDPDVIASGPTVPDPTTFGETIEVCKRYEIWDQLPEAVRAHVKRGSRDESMESPKPGSRYFERVHTELLGTNRIALEAARDAASDLGYVVAIESDTETGEARDVGRRQVESALVRSIDRPTCLLWGGETTVTVKGGGKGGRNQEAALAAALALAETGRDLSYLSGGTDGIDGPTDAAGAWCRPDTVLRARDRGLDPAAFLQNNDAYTFFDRMDQLLRPGPTHTNVMDVQIVLIQPGSTGQPSTG